MKESHVDEDILLVFLHTTWTLIAEIEDDVLHLQRGE